METKTNTKSTSKYIPPVVSEGFFKITGVKYRGENCTYELYDNLTNPMSPHKLAEFYETQKQKGNPYPMDSILTFSILESAVNSGDDDLKNSLHKKLRENWINSLSRIIYNPSGIDEIIHNFETSDVYSLKGKIVGPEDYIENLEDTNYLKLILGTENVKEINEISNGINKTPFYVWRFNSKPSEKQERMVVFGAFSDWFYLDCGRFPLVEVPAFRVLRIK